MKNNRLTKTVLACSAIAFTIFTTGCTNTGVVPLSNGVYYLSNGDMWSMGGAPSKRVVDEVYVQAHEFCNKKGLNFKELKHSYTPTSYGQSPTYTVEFKCTSGN